VSKNVMPASSAAATSAGTPSGGSVAPKVFHPRPATETTRPLSPSCRKDISPAVREAGGVDGGTDVEGLLTRATLSLSPALHRCSPDLHVHLEHWRGDHR